MRMIHKSNNRSGCKKFFLLFCFLLLPQIFFAQSNQWYKVTDFAKKINAQVFYEAVSETITFSKNNEVASIGLGESFVVLNRSRIEFAPAPIKQDRVFLLHEKMAGVIENFFAGGATF